MCPCDDGSWAKAKGNSHDREQNGDGIDWRDHANPSFSSIDSNCHESQPVESPGLVNVIVCESSD